MVVNDAVFDLRDEVFGKAELLGQVPDAFGEGFVGISLLVNLQVGISNHIHNNHSGEVKVQLGSEISSYREWPSFNIALVLGIKESEPKAETFGFFQATGEFQKHSCTTVSIVSSGDWQMLQVWWVAVGYRARIVMCAQQNSGAVPFGG